MLEIKKYDLGIQFNRGILTADEGFAHFIEGKHRGWSGRRYRRGKNRCHYCGAPLNAPDDPNWLKDRIAAAQDKAFESVFLPQAGKLESSYFGTSSESDNQEVLILEKVKNIINQLGEPPLVPYIHYSWMIPYDQAFFGEAVDEIIEYLYPNFDPKIHKGFFVSERWRVDIEKLISVDGGRVNE